MKPRFTENFQKDRFITKAKLLYGELYDYSLVEYVAENIKVKIICPIHGIFEKTPTKHLHRNARCPYCFPAVKPKSSLSEFIEKAKEVHGNRYDYSQTEYNHSKEKINVICNLHGKFTIRAAQHLIGQGCRLCGIEKRTISQRNNLEDNISKANIIHNNKYDYSLIDNRVKMHDVVEIICPFHGIFKQSLASHINHKSECPRCLKQVSDEQRNIFNIIRQYYPETILEYKIDGISVDIFIPSLNIAIEYNGIYWHSIESGKDKFHLRNKFLKLRKINIKLINIYEDEWLNFNLEIKSLLFKILNINIKYIQINNIWKCTSDNKYFDNIVNFFNKFHYNKLLDYKDTISYNIISDNQIKYSILFKYIDIETVEIIADCFYPNINIENKLLMVIDRFKSDFPQFKFIQIYLDLRYFDEIDYIKDGFKIIEYQDIALNLINVKKLTRINYDKNIYKNATSTIYTIPNCGSIKLIKNISSVN